MKQLTLSKDSDHKPILLLKDWEVNFSYFDFENMWMKLEGFLDWVKEWLQEYTYSMGAQILS